MTALNCTVQSMKPCQGRCSEYGVTMASSSCARWQESYDSIEFEFFQAML